MNAGKTKYRLQGKKPSHREALVKSLMLELLRGGKVRTTPAKAKILKAKIDRLITTAKKDTGASKVQVEKLLPTKDAVARMYRILPAFSGRNSGYTRIIRTMTRKGDGAEQVYVVFTDEITKPKKKSLIEKTVEKQTKKPAKPKKNK